MPSVGMRRSTRIFGARILRSGRRLCTSYGKLKRLRLDQEDWIELFNNSDDGGLSVVVGCKENVKCEITEVDIDAKLAEPEAKDAVTSRSVRSYDKARMWGAVYQKKRKRVNSENSSLDVDMSKRPVEGKRYGKQYARKKFKKRARCNADENLQGRDGCNVLVARGTFSTNCSSWFACFLNSVFGYMSRENLRVSQLSAFLSSEPVTNIYGICGIQFLLDSNLNETSGICKIWETFSSIPLFTLKFPAVPHCFMHLISSMYLALALTFHHQLVISSKNVDMKDERTYNEKDSLYLHLKKDRCGGKTLPHQKIEPRCIDPEFVKSGKRNIASWNGKTGSRTVFKSIASAAKGSRRAKQLINGVHFHSVRKRRSLRSKSGQNPGKYFARKNNGDLASGLCSCRPNATSLCRLSSCNDHRNSVQIGSSIGIREPMFTAAELMQGLDLNLDSVSCSANLLITEFDKCYRQVGAIVTLEFSTLYRQWFLVIKRDGVTKYCLTAQKNMRSSSCNRISQAIIWTVDNGWELEFSERREWLIFKEFYRRCSDRNVPASTSGEIPVPGVCNVLSSPDSNDTPFRRPYSYITVKDDEVSRALVRKTANYDLDSDDEEWLKKFNSRSYSENNLLMELSNENFELIIDAFEKGSYWRPDEYFNVKEAVNLLLHLGRREVLETVHDYWMRKRKQKRSAMIKIFQYYQPRKVQVIPKHILRKKRSFKRPISHLGREKQQTSLQANQEAIEEDALLKVQQAKAAASRSESLAVLKRQKAQLLVEKADLATYRAAMALRIAEAVQIADPSNTAVTFLTGGSA